MEQKQLELLKEQERMRLFEMDRLKELSELGFPRLIFAFNVKELTVVFLSLIPIVMFPFLFGKKQPKLKWRRMKHGRLASVY